MPASRMFLDAGGSAPLTPRVREALQAGFAEGWADPARLSAESRHARALLDGAREGVADALGTRPEQVHFTSSGVAAIERSIGAVWTARRGREDVVASAIERDATVHAVEHVARRSPVTVGVDAEGRLDLDAFSTAVADPAVAIAAIQHANHELGTVQDLAAVREAAARHEVPLVVDATSSVGHIAAPEHWDALAANPADWGGPAGIGVVAMRPRTRWLPTWPESDGWAPGGPSVPLALAAAVALQERLEQAESTAARLSALITRVRERMAAVPGVEVVGDPDHRLPHVVTFSCLYISGEALLARLDREGIAVGSGSACTTSSLEPSRVLAAIGALTHGNVRLALHPGISEADIDRFLDVVPRVIAEIRSDSGAPALG